MATEWWQDDWIRSVSVMLVVWFVGIVAASAFLIFYGDLLYRLLG